VLITKVPLLPASVESMATTSSSAMKPTRKISLTRGKWPTSRLSN